jgi:phosphoglycerate dehydrogenase-like enzyme
VLAESLGMQVIFTTWSPSCRWATPVQVANLDELLAHRDVVTLHVPELPPPAT